MRLIERARLLDRVPVSVHELQNGMRVVLAHVERKPIVSCQIWYGIGSADERPGKTGLAHFLEHLMFKGTERHPEGIFDRILERLGGDTNAATWLDWTYYKVKVPVVHLPTVLDLEADRMMNLRIGEAGFLSEKEVVKNERLLRVENDPNGLAEERFFDQFFGAHPYAQPTIGTMEDIEGLELDDVLNFYDQYYVPSNAVLSLAGRIDEDEVLRVVNDTFGALQPGKPRDRQGLEESRQQIREKQAVLDVPVGQARMLVGYPSPRKYTVESMQGSMMSELLLGARSSALHRRTVTEEELAVYASGWLGALHKPSMFQIEWLLADPRFEGRVFEILDEEIARVRAGKIDEAELDGARNRMRMTLLSVLQNVGALSSLLGEMALLGGDVSWYNKADEIVRKMSARDVAAYAKTFMVADARASLIARPVGAGTGRPSGRSSGRGGSR